MTWTWDFVDDGQGFKVWNPSNDLIETVPNDNGVVNGVPPDVEELVIERDMRAVLRGDIEQR